MTDEGAKALAAAIEKLADAVRAASHPVITNVPPAAPQWPQPQPWTSSLWVTTCGTVTTSSGTVGEI